MAQSMASHGDWTRIWLAARDRLRRDIGDATFDTWISPLTFVSAEKDEVRIGAPKPFHRNWVANKHLQRIEDALKAEGGSFTSVSLVVEQQPATRLNPPRLEAPKPVETKSIEQPEIHRGLTHRLLNPAQTFESFVPGPANEFGYRAAQALANGETSDIPLLYIHGGFGYGKSHLLTAIALEAKKRGRRVALLGAEDFMRQFLGAVSRKDTLSFKEELRAADILLIDDLQHLCRSTYTVAEFLHTLNAFSDQHRKLVIAADKAPVAIDNLGEDVRSRLSGGLVIALDKPDRATRLAILKSRAADYVRNRPQAPIPDEVLERLADLEDASPRDLIGVFTKLATYADLTKQPVTMEVVENTLGQRTIGTRKASIEDIQRKIAEFYKLELRDFQSAGRARRIARPRQVAMYLAREITARSLPEIGKRFGGRDHTTVLHACRRIAELCQEDPLFKQEVDFLKTVLSRTVQ
jgi:chromosomal replication initiator protein